MTLATVTDLQDRLGRDLTADEAARADAVLADVSAAVSLYTGQTFEKRDYELRTRVRRGFVRLPQRPVHSVATATDRFDNPVQFDWDGLDRVYINCNRFGCAPVQVVDITYNAGPDTVPAAIVGVVCGIVLRALGQSPTDGAVVSEAIDEYSYRIGATGAAGSFGVLADEKRILDRYRRTGGTILTWS